MPSPRYARIVVRGPGMHAVARARVTVATAALLAITPMFAAAQSRYVAPDENTIRSTMEAVPGRSNSRVVRIQNLSTVPIVVTQVVLINCNNVEFVCGMNKMETTIEPGKRKTVLKVEPAIESRAASFSYRFQWRHKSTEAILGTLASAGDSTAAARLAQVQRVEAARAASARPGEGELYAHELIALGDKVAALRADPDSVVIPVGSGTTVTMLRIIAVDAKGNSLGRLRSSYRFSLERGDAVSLARPDSILAQAPGRQVLTVRLPDELSAGRATSFGEVRFTIVVP